MDEEPSECSWSEDEHGMIFRAEYEVVGDEDGNCHPIGASVNTHLHGVPPEAATATMVMAAVKMLADHMAHTTFGMFADNVAHVMATAAAKAYLTSAIESLSDDSDEYAMEIPNDISELLKGD